VESFDCDVLVIGGGPGGSTAAALARLAGLSVCVAEREAFPRFHIGESLLPMANAVFQASGAWPKIKAAGFLPKYGAEFKLADGSETKDVVFADGYVPGLESTFQVERSRFDSLLLDHARELGAEVRMETTVTAAVPDATGVTATLTRRDGAVAGLRARWVIDAGGRENHFELPEKRRYDPPPFAKRAAVYSHFDGVERAAGPRGGNIIIVRIADGWFWLIPLSPTRTSVGLVTALGTLRAARDPAKVFADTVASSPYLRAVLARAEPAEPFRVTADYSYVRNEFAGPRYLLTGDAAGFYDPIFSSGVYLSVFSAQRAVALIARAQRAGRTLTAGERRGYTRELKRHCAVFRSLIGIFYDNDSFAVFMTQKPPLDLSCGLISIVAGHARLIWPLWWRFRLFLLVCRLQRFVPLCKRIDQTVRVVPNPA